MNHPAIASRHPILPSKGESSADQPDELRSWRLNQSELSFVYARSMGSLIQTGRAALTRLDSQYLELRSQHTTMLVVVRDAKFSTEPQLFFNSSFTSARYVPGVSISLASFDWLFLTLTHDHGLLANGRLLASG